MKQAFLFVLSCSFFTAIYAQNNINIVKEHYTVSGGLLGAANFTEFRIDDNDNLGIHYNTKTGWSAGGWVNFPISSGVSIEPQLMYSSYRYFTNTSTQMLLNDGKISFISLPVLLKFHLGDKFAITAGPQVDFLSSVDDNNNTAQEEDFKKTSLALSGGLELFPHGRVTIFGRYLHGLTNMDNRESHSGPDVQYKNQNIQAGLKLRLFGTKVDADSDGDGVSDPKDKCPNVVGVARYEGCPVPDSDNDGINDEQDKCPNQPGTAKYQGCPIPDSDGDGINDELDKCPNQAGTAKYQGCPIPDSDGDGINDEEDKCPNQAGPSSRNGCPVTDRDNDGVNDDVDRCPDIPGVAGNNGCPDVPANVSKTLSVSAQNISFGASNAKLTTKSNTALNQVVKILNENPSLKIKIEGHTDNAGNDETNMKLSEDRAAAVKAYLVSKGISEDRISSEGFGETMPIADNNTAAGRTQNRRVEIKIDY
jgi:outer membrane protein OmpA-like peptidoglycan-associated protein